MSHTGPFSHLSDRFPVELGRIGRLVEVEVAAEDLVRSLPAEHHLAAGGLNAPGQQDHGCGSTHSGHIERLQVVDDV